MSSKQSIGKFGELCVQRYLSNHGFFILQMNKHSRFGEIDILAKKGSTLHLIEVKTRTSTTFGLPEHSMTKKKFYKMKKVLCEMIENKQTHGARTIHIDFAAVEYDKLKNHVRIRFYWNIGIEDCL